MDRSFFVASILSILFTVALVYATLEAPSVVSQVILNVIPDYGIDEWKVAESLIETFRPVGYASFIITLILMVIGFASKWKPLSILGSLTLYLPVFGYFASTMFFLAGIGILRLLWLPLLDTSPRLLELGSIVYLPYLLLEYMAVSTLNAVYGDPILAFRILRFFRVALTLAVMGVGILIFLLGVFTWLHIRFKGLELADIWVYRYSRHPQYLGILLWSYGLLLLSTYILAAPKGGYVPPPSLPWLISALALAGLSLIEEIDMTRRYGEKYERYHREAPFLLPLPRVVSKLLSAPARMILKKDYLENRKEATYLILIYAAVLILLSVPWILF